RVYPESQWMTEAVKWALTSVTPPEDGARLGAELEKSVGPAPWVAGSIFLHNHERMIDFMSHIVEWVALTVQVTDDDWRVGIDDNAVSLLFRQNPGVYAELYHVVTQFRRI